MSDPIPNPTPVGVPPATKTSPKVVAAQAWAFIAPVLLAAAMALVSWLLTDDGRTVFRELPVWAQVPIFAAVASLAARLGGYLQRDGLREEGARALYGTTNAERDAAGS